MGNAKNYQNITDNRDDDILSNDDLKVKHKDKYINNVYGIYKLIDVLDTRNKDGHLLYKGVYLECGYQKIGTHSDFASPGKVTITCKHLNQNGNYKTFGAYVWDNQRIGKIFNGMKRRCYIPSEKSYKWYGTKGIKICDEWLKNPKAFEDWSMANGYSDGLTIDRIHEDKDYSPENCQWIDGIDNSKYKSTTSLIEVNGEIHTGRDWAKTLELGPNIINTYVRKYGLDNIIEFIKRYKIDNTLKPKHKQSYYDLYMNNNIK